jgi:hypothetical protein
VVYGEADDLAHCDGYGNKVNNAEKCKAYYYKNKEKRLAQLRAYQERNREQYLAQRRARYRAKTRAWEDKVQSDEQRAMKLIMEAVNSPYTKVNDGGNLHPDKNDGYSEDQEPEGVVWIASRPDKVMVGVRHYSYKPWVQAVLEAENRVYLLVQKGHRRSRAVLDLHYEMALACDDCGLWSAVGHRSSRDKFSTEYETGELLAAEACDPQAVHKLFGRAFDPASAFDREHAVDYGEDSSQARRGASNAATTKKRRS